MSFGNKRIGLTMRGSNATGYDEARDGLARDWIAFMKANLPGVIWFPIPNIGTEAVRYIDELGLNGLLFTGGDDLGSYPERDETESALLKQALKSEIPVLGICRGAQLINTQLGGKLVKTEGDTHCATTHPIRFLKNDLGFSGTHVVNSYHNWTIPLSGLATGLSPLAMADDESIEAYVHDSCPVVALMWHPERPQAVQMKSLLNTLWPMI